MALLSSTTYNRLAKNFGDARLVLANMHGETYVSESLVNLTKTKSKINTRWNTSESSNISPFTYAALTIKGKPVLTSAIKPIERTPYGYIDIQYESDD